MKKITNLLLLTLLVFVFTNCAKEAKFTENINYVSFEKTAIKVVVNKNSTINRDISVYTTQVSGSDRTFNISVVPAGTTAVAGAYTVPASVTIPANTNSGVFTLGVADVSIAANGVKLVLAFETADGLFIGNNTTITITKYCPLVITDFLGDFNIKEAGYGTYPTTITLDPVVANRIWVSNFWDWTNDLAYYDFDPTNGTVTMPSQVIKMGDGKDYTCVGSGTYNACAATFHMTYQGDVAGTVHDFSPAVPGKKASYTSSKRGM